MGHRVEYVEWVSGLHGFHAYYSQPFLHFARSVTSLLAYPRVPAVAVTHTSNSSVGQSRHNTTDSCLFIAREVTIAILRGSGA